MYVGHDAELAVVDGKGDAVPAHLFFPSKMEPLYTDDEAIEYSSAHRSQVFRDGTSLEVNTPGCITCIATMLWYTRLSMQVAKRRLPAGYGFAAVSSYEIKGDALKGAPPDVLESGCHPVKNAYEGWEDRAAYSDMLGTRRYAGGHTHWSYQTMEGPLSDEKQKKEFCPYVVRHLDLYGAVPLIYIGVEGKEGTRRRAFYGKAGEYRAQEYPKSKALSYPWHGIEYRVLGPEWLRDIALAGVTMLLLRSILRRAINKWQAGRPMLEDRLLMEAREAINEGDTKSIFESAAYQKRFEKALLEASSSSSLHGMNTEHFRFMRENREKLFSGKLTLMDYVGDTHHSFPQCLQKWGFGVKV